MSEYPGDVTKTFSPYSFGGRDKATVSDEKNTDSVSRSETSAQNDSRPSTELELVKRSDSIPEIDPAKSQLAEDRNDWTCLQQYVPHEAALCLRNMYDEDQLLETRLESILMDEGKAVFRLIRDIAWSAAHCAVQRPLLEKIVGSDTATKSEWRLSELHSLHSAMKKEVELVTTDSTGVAASQYSARQEFACRVYIFRVLYRHAEGKDSKALGEHTAHLFETYSDNPKSFVQEVVRQTSALRWLRECTDKVNEWRVQPAAFPSLLRDLSNAKKHPGSPLKDHEALFFGYKFPLNGFAVGCWPIFRPALIEWMRASRLDSLWPAEAVKEEGQSWLMNVDRGQPKALRVDRGRFDIQKGHKYVVSEHQGRYFVRFPFVENLSLPEEL